MTGLAAASGWLKAQDEAGVLVRICATITGRGYEVRSLTAEASPAGTLTVSFSVLAEEDWLVRLPYFLQRIVPVHEVVLDEAPWLDTTKEALG